MVKILVAEDDEALRRLVCAELGKGGYEVCACADGEEAARTLESEPFDMLIADVMMPKKDGFTLAEEVREQNKHIPILFMTALDDMPSRKRGYRIGIDDYVVKPFDTEVLLLRVGALLRRANIEKSREIAAGNLRTVCPR